MRLRIDAVTGAHIERVALAENRSRAEACRILIGEAIRQRHGRPPQPPVVDVEDGAIRGTTIATHVKGQILAGVQRFAMLEDRSLSAALRILLRDALRQRGVLPSPSSAHAPLT
jgi:hypothetical protein